MHREESDDPKRVNEQRETKATKEKSSEHKKRTQRKNINGEAARGGRMNERKEKTLPLLFTVFFCTLFSSLLFLFVRFRTLQIRMISLTFPRDFISSQYFSTILPEKVTLRFFLQKKKKNTTNNKHSKKHILFCVSLALVLWLNDDRVDAEEFAFAFVFKHTIVIKNRFLIEYENIKNINRS